MKVRGSGLLFNRSNLWRLMNCNPAHREMILEEMEFTIEMSCLEQQYRTQKRLPTIDEYWTYRLGTNLMGVVCAATE